MKNLKKLLGLLFWVILGVGCKEEQISIGNSVQNKFYIVENKRALAVNVFGNTSSKKFILLPGLETLNKISEKPWVMDMAQSMAFVVLDFTAKGDLKNQGSKTADINEMAELMSLASESIFERYGKDIKLIILGDGQHAPIALATAQKYKLPTLATTLVLINPIFNPIEAANFSIAKIKLDSKSTVGRLKLELLGDPSNNSYKTSLINWENAQEIVSQLPSALNAAQANQLYALDLENIYKDSLVIGYQSNWSKTLFDTMAKPNFKNTFTASSQVIAGKSIFDFREYLDQYNVDLDVEKLNQKVVIFHGEQNIFCTKLYLNDQLTKAKKLVNDNFIIYKYPKIGHDLMQNKWLDVKRILLQL